VDPQVVELIKIFLAPIITGGGAIGFYLLYRKFEQERVASLREDNKTLREENKDFREEVRKLREELRGDES
jgi:cell division protein FtsB